MSLCFFHSIIEASLEKLFHGGCLPGKDYLDHSPPPVGLASSNYGLNFIFFSPYVSFSIIAAHLAKLSHGGCLPGKDYLDPSPPPVGLASSNCGLNLIFFLTLSLSVPLSLSLYY